MRVLLLFLLLISFVRADMDKDVLSYYIKYKNDYLVKEKQNLYRIATDKNSKQRTVSEGQGYGMLIVSLIGDKQEIFDGLWRFSRKYPSSISKDLMSWQIPEVKGENDSAFDGDADIAYALIQADRRWGSRGKINYKKEAKTVLDAIWKYTIGKNSFLPLLGDWVDLNGEKYNQYTSRTSDFMLAHFKEFYKFTGDQKWLKVVQASQQALLDVQNTTTGLVPDFIRYSPKLKRYLPSEEGFLEKYDGEYYYNACRVPFRVGIDANHGDSTSKIIAKRFSIWSKAVTGEDPLKLKSGFKLDGKVIGDYFSILFIAPMGVAAMSDDPAWSQKIFDAVKNRHENYYEDSVALLSMMAMRGYF
jgi:endo-1,4-beta-D-glucanase Y